MVCYDILYYIVLYDVILGTTWVQMATPETTPRLDGRPQRNFD